MDRFTLGKADIRRVEELRAPMPFAIYGEGMLERHADWLVPRWVSAGGELAERTWDMVVQSWIVVVDDRVVVIDPCVGNGRSLPHFSLFDQLDTPFIERFSATGIRPEEVDQVFCTHLHSDHCGWNTTLRDGRFVPTFPNARYLLAQKELDRWNPDLPGYRHVPENAGIFAASVRPVIEAGLVDVVGERHRISPSLETQPAYGHTLGHSVVHLASAGKQAWFTGDVFHHPIELIHPEIDAHTCEDFGQTLATRERLIARFIATGALVIPAHFAEPHVGYLREVDGRRVFEPMSGP